MNDWKGIGNLVRDPELSYTPNTQTAKCVFTIAVNRPKRNGEDQGTDYIKIVTWGRRAETCNTHLFKGRKVGISGPIRTGSYKDREGRTVYTTEVWADEVEFLTPASQPAPQQSTTAANFKHSTTVPVPQQETFGSFDDLPDTFAAAEDDIPF